MSEKIRYIPKDYHRRDVLHAAVGSVLPEIPTIPDLPTGSIARSEMIREGINVLRSSFTQERARENLPVPEFYDGISPIMGVHLTAVSFGGSRFKESLNDVEEITGLKGSEDEATEGAVVTSLFPGAGLTQEARKRGIRVIARLDRPNGVFDYYRIQTMLHIHKIHGPEGVRLPVQVRNETTTERSIDGSTTRGKDEAKFLVPQMRIVAQGGGIPLITPLAPFSPNELDETWDMFQGIRNHPDYKHVAGTMGLALHQYTFLRISTGQTEPEERQNLLHRFNVINQMAKDVFGRPLTIHVTEAGLFQDGTQNYTPEEVRTETLRHAQLILPDNVKSYTLWIHRNDDRPPALNPEQAAEIAKFDPACLRISPTEVSPSFVALKEVADKKREDIQSRRHDLYLPL